MGCFCFFMIMSLIVAIVGFAKGDVALGVVASGCVVVTLVIGGWWADHTDRQADAASDASSAHLPLLMPQTPWWSPEPLPAAKQVKVTITGYYEKDYPYRRHWLYADACYTWSWGTPPGQYDPHDKLFFDDSTDPAVPFRAAAHLHTYDFLYTGRDNCLLLLLNTTQSHSRRDGLTVAIAPLTDADRALLRSPSSQESEDTADTAPPADTIIDLDAFDHPARLATLQLEYDASPHYIDEEFLKAHGEKHARDLVQDRQAIIDRYVVFHRDRAFEAYLKEHAPHLLQFARWEVAALAYAEKYLVQVRERPKTEEEKLARILRKRQAKLLWDRVPAEDQIARRQQALTLIREHDEMIDASDLDEDIKIQLKEEFRDDILNSLSAQGGERPAGSQPPFKQV